MLASRPRLAQIAACLAGVTAGLATVSAAARATVAAVLLLALAALLLLFTTIWLVLAWQRRPANPAQGESPPMSQGKS